MQVKESINACGECGEYKDTYKIIVGGETIYLCSECAHTLINMLKIVVGEAV